MCLEWKIKVFSFVHTQTLGVGLSIHRVLAFSPHGIKSVRVWLDGGPLPPATRVQEGPLYTTPWDPAQLGSGTHTITMVVEVSNPVNSVGILCQFL